MSSYPLYPLSANHVHKLSADTQSFAPEITFEKTPRFLGKVYDKVIVFSLYNPQIEMFARFKMKSSFHKTKRII